MTELINMLIFTWEYIGYQKLFEILKVIYLMD